LDLPRLSEVGLAGAGGRGAQAEAARLVGTIALAEDGRPGVG
jgi:hypothetical protein